MRAIPKIKIKAVESRINEGKSGGLHSLQYTKYHKAPDAVIKQRFELLQSHLALLNLSEPSRAQYASAIASLQASKNRTYPPGTAKQISTLYLDALKESKSNGFEHRMIS